MPRNEKFEAGGVELDELAVQHPRVRVDAHLHGTEIDCVNLDQDRRSDDPTPLRQNFHLAGSDIVRVAGLVVVDEVDPADVEDPECDEAEDDEAEDEHDKYRYELRNTVLFFHLVDHLRLPVKTSS